MTIRPADARSAQVTIARPWREVCDFLAEPRHYARWASWLASLRRDRGHWVARTPRGARARVRFTERNAYGVADHSLLEAEDAATHVALRAVPHGDGSAVVATVFGDPPLHAARRDLQRLKALLERASPN